MSENCDNCKNVEYLKDKIKSLWNVINELKENVRDFEKRISGLEKAKAEDRKDLKQLFDAIKKIEASITHIATSLDKLSNEDEKRDAEKYRKIIWTIASFLILSVMGLLWGILTGKIHVTGA